MQSVISRFINSSSALCILSSNDNLSPIKCFCCFSTLGLDIEMWLLTQILTIKFTPSKTKHQCMRKFQAYSKLQNIILCLVDLFFVASEKVNCENSTETSNSRLSHNTSVRQQNVWSAVNLPFSYYQELHFPTQTWSFWLKVPSHPALRFFKYYR